MPLRLRQLSGKTEVWDPLRKKWIVLTPEEHVRQCLIQFLITEMHYPIGLMAVEKRIIHGERIHRFDLAVFDRERNPWLLAECKEPQEQVGTETLFQLLRYHRFLPAKYWLLTNGHSNYCAKAGTSVEEMEWLNTLPAYNP